MRGMLLTFAVAVAVGPQAFAQEVEELVVTGSRVDEGVSMPGTFLRKKGDFLLLEVAVTNDTRDAKARKEEIYATLRGALAAARRDGSIELSVIDDGLVIPLKVDSATVALRAGGKADTDTTTISVKTRIPASGADGQALISKLKDFVSSLKVTGRTELNANGDIEISVVGPNNYRDEIITLFAADANRTSRALGDGYKVVVQNIDRPVRWVRIGLLELALYVPYSYQVLPATVTSITFNESD